MEPIQEEINLDELSREEQKVIIAQDVINNVHAELYVANKNRYINISYKDIEDIEDIQWWEVSNMYADKDVKSNWNQIKTCKVCALGACIMSITKYKNTLTFEELPEGKADWHSKQTSHISSVFSPEELCLIEIMFEGEYSRSDWSGWHNVGRDNLGASITEEQAEKAKAFYRTFDDENDRLIGIMQHIIDNKGQIIL